MRYFYCLYQLWVVTCYRYLSDSFFKTAGGKYLALVGLFLVSDCTGGVMGLWILVRVVVVVLWGYSDSRCVQMSGCGEDTVM